MMDDLLIRDEQPEDAPGVRQVNTRAFETPLEADIVDRLRATCEERLSLVALVEDRVVGHILFTPVKASSAGLQGMGLAPMAVDPDVQRRGIGSALVREGLERLGSAGYPFVVVLGHPEYYPRFGFEPASRFGGRSEFEGVPDEAFMAILLDSSRCSQPLGRITYRPEISEA